MKTSLRISFFILFIISSFSNSAYAVTPSQRAAINIWLQQQENINPRPLKIISNLKNNTKNYKINIYSYSIDLNNINISASTRNKSNISKYIRILDSTIMFDEIKVINIRQKNNRYYFKLKLKQANADKRRDYKKSKHTILKSKTKVKYLISALINKIKPMGKLNYFCPTSPLKDKPNHVGARVKLIIFSYQIKFSGSYKNIKNVIDQITSNVGYISMHNLKIKTTNKLYSMEADLRFYHLASRLNKLDKSFIFKLVKTDKICQ